MSACAAAVDGTGATGDAGVAMCGASGGRNVDWGCCCGCAPVPAGRAAAGFSALSCRTCFPAVGDMTVGAAETETASTTGRASGAATTGLGPLGLAADTTGAATDADTAGAATGPIACAGAAVTAAMPAVPPSVAEGPAAAAERLAVVAATAGAASARGGCWLGCPCCRAPAAGTAGVKGVAGVGAGASPGSSASRAIVDAGGATGEVAELVAWAPATGARDLGAAEPPTPNGATLFMAIDDVGPPATPGREKLAPVAGISAGSSKSSS